MKDGELGNLALLVVEDEYLLAMELGSYLADAGAHVVGPVATIEDALALIETEPRIDGAILDANLQGDMVFPVADKLSERNVPFLFTTGYDASIIPSRFKNIGCIGKPTSMSKLCQEISRIVARKRLDTRP
ncbi:response regulator [Rhizobium mesoamericanum]|uniref:Putative response regulator receiver (CheY-like protein) n=1 Tax=Rhizobium mesoamericanum STM3625 TaxID=1211777 RepID=K0PZJ8_9HYPH|nr:response regulator [Rhizobium mesoamericanum]CCM79438.1 putative response regulator receiver (CheY-like protein) [Rhizobium mesoamericanum STM3625]